MFDIFISYLVTCKNEGTQLRSLIQLLNKYLERNEIVILDDYSNDIEIIKLKEEISNNPIGNVKWYQHALNQNYSEHKNYGKSLCRGKYIFQIDADELPSVFILENINTILESNPDIDLFWLPRINDFIGVNEDNA